MAIDYKDHPSTSKNRADLSTDYACICGLAIRFMKMSTNNINKFEARPKCPECGKKML